MIITRKAPPERGLRNRYFNNNSLLYENWIAYHCLSWKTLLVSFPESVCIKYIGLYDTWIGEALKHKILNLFYSWKISKLFGIIYIQAGWKYWEHEDKFSVGTTFNLSRSFHHSLSFQPNFLRAANAFQNIESLEQWIKDQFRIKTINICRIILRRSQPWLHSKRRKI